MSRPGPVSPLVPAEPPVDLLAVGGARQASQQGAAAARQPGAELDLQLGRQRQLGYSAQTETQ